MHRARNRVGVHAIVEPFLANQPPALLGNGVEANQRATAVVGVGEHGVVGLHGTVADHLAGAGSNGHEEGCKT